MSKNRTAIIVAVIGAAGAVLAGALGLLKHDPAPAGPPPVVQKTVYVGKVADPTGNRLQNAKILIEVPPHLETTFSDSEGYFRFEVAGSAAEVSGHVHVTAEGFQPYDATSTFKHAGAPTEIRLTALPGPTTTTSPTTNPPRPTPKQQAARRVQIRLEPSENSRIIGGEGGDGYTANCAGDQALVGFAGKHDPSNSGAITRVSGRCAPLTFAAGQIEARLTEVSETPTRGGGYKGDDFLLQCPAGQVIAGVELMASAYEKQLYVNYLLPTCATLSLNYTGKVTRRDTITLQPAGRHFPNAVQKYDFSCPDHSIAVGFRGRSGNWLDSIGLDCASVSLQ